MKRQVNDSQESIIEFVADTNDGLPFSDKIVGQTSFIDEKRVRAGYNVFYATVQDVQLAALNHANAGNNLRYDYKTKIKLRGLTYTGLVNQFVLNHIFHAALPFINRYGHFKNSNLKMYLELN